MALHRYSRVRGLTGEVTVDVRQSGVSGFDDRKRVVSIETEGDVQLTPDDWAKLVREVEELLGHRVNMDRIVNMFVQKLWEEWGREPCTLEEAGKGLSVDCHIQPAEVRAALAHVMGNLELAADGS